MNAARRKCHELPSRYEHLLGPLRKIDDLLEDVRVLVFDQTCAEQFGMVRGNLLRQGISVNTVDLMIAAVALAHDLTLATHNTGDFQDVPGLRVEDWLSG